MPDFTHHQKLMEQCFPELENSGYIPDLAQLKEVFFTRTGTPSLDDPSFESRMQLFEDWIFLDVLLPDGVCLLADLVRRSRLAPHLVKIATALCVSQPGLFVLMAPWKKQAWFRDLLWGADFVLHDPEPVAGLEPGQILQGRLYADTQLRISPGMVVHAKEATEAVAKLVQFFRNKDCTDLLHLLAKLAWRAGHYPRHAPRHFYDPANPLVRDIFSTDPVP